MTAGGSRRTLRTLTAALLCCALGGVGLTLTLLAGWSDPAPAPFVFPWPVLAALYVVAQRLTIDFEFRRQSRSISLSQLPLALGAVAVAPGLHLVAALLGTLGVCLLRRQAPVRTLFNLSMVAAEVGTVTLAVHAVEVGEEPQLSLWLALLAGLLVSELAGHGALAAVWRLLDMPLTREQVVPPLLVGLASTVMFAAVAVVSVAAVWQDPAITVVILLLVGGLTVAYRGYRRLAAQQATTGRLYDFVKALGPLDLDAPQGRETLEQARVLLHARCLDLALCAQDGTWQHVMVWEGDAADEDQPPSRDLTLAEEVASTGTSALRRHRGSSDQMATPVVGSTGLLGTLTVMTRLGDVRDFDMGDLRLLETVAAELATALERGRMLSTLARAATTDALTGLPNLPETTQRLAALCASRQPLVLAAVAVESFREVNDALGHQVGDDLLQEVARRLQALPDVALVGRIGGGRFAVAATCPAGTDAALLGLQLRAQVEGSATVGGTGTHVRLAVGIARAPDHGDDPATLLRRAQTAMYGARHAHGGPVLWEPAYELRGQRRMAVVSALREAIGSGAIAVAYQPKVDAVSGAVTGVEALARWTHPALGAVTPDEFIPLAEASGVMRPLTAAVLAQALAACRGWQRDARDIGVSVNVDADTVLDASFITDLSSALGEAGLPPELLTLELTETVLLHDPGLAVERMAELRRLGVRISVDDFGTGYSSLTYLKGLPVDEVKIDKGFVTGLEAEPADRAVVRGVVDIAHTLGLKVVAEGVERAAQQRLLLGHGVDEVQGYLYARPMPPSAMSRWLRTHARATP